jgi:ABC-type transporter Mla subunit MlaD
LNGDRRAFFRVGVLVLAGIAMVIGLVWFFGGGEFSQGTVFESYFPESVQGLEVGAPVKYRGVTVGRVTDLGLVSAEYATHVTPDQLDRSTYRLVFVRFIVDTKRIGTVLTLSEAIKLGLRARLASQGITGLTYLELDFANPAQYPVIQVPWTPRYQYVPSMPSTLAQVQNAATQFLAKLNRIDIDTLARSTQGLLEDLQASLTRGDLHETLLRTTRLLQTLDEMARAADLPGLTADLRQTAASLRALAQNGDLHQTLANAAVMSDRLAEASARLTPLITQLQMTVRRVDSSTADVQQALVPILRDARDTAANLRDASEQLRRYPAQLLVGAPPPRPQEQGR